MTFKKGEMAPGSLVRHYNVAADAPRILAILADFQDEYGYAPTLKELMHLAGLHSIGSVRSRLALLEQQGYVRVMARIPRAIQILSGGTARPAFQDDPASHLEHLAGQVDACLEAKILPPMSRDHCRRAAMSLRAAATITKERSRNGW